MEAAILPGQVIGGCTTEKPISHAALRPARSEAEICSLRQRVRYLEDTALFLSEKMSLEVVVAAVLDAAAGDRGRAQEAEQRVEDLCMR